MWKERKAVEVSVESWGSILKCPSCGEDYLHQSNTTVYARSEDADWTTVIAQDGEDVVATKFPSADTHNPSSRRHGLTIQFWCETCSNHDDSKPFHLAIYQHKGSTYLEWVS